MSEHEDTFTGLDAQTYAALPAERKMEIAVILLKRGDMMAIENLGIEVIDADELTESDAVMVERFE